MFFRRLNWNVVAWFNTVSYISYAIIALGVVAMIYHFATTGSALRLGLSFTGGTDITVTYGQSVTREQIAGALGKVGVSDAQINTLGKTGDVGTPRWTIETQKDFGNDSAPLKAALATVAPIIPSQVSVSTVGPSLSHEYLFNAIKALVIAIAIQFLYIAFRFGWNYIFGLVTVIALVRDSAMMIGIYAIANKRVDDAFLAAVLTVIGYSVMDTIVILDRIRENVKLMSNEKFDRIVNTSILQTMTRSVNTLATVVVTLVALLALGGASLQNFAFALLVGICSGGYHSIFYSAPLVAKLQNSQRLRAAASTTVLESPRTKAEARQQAAKSTGRAPVDRDSVNAARKARRERERLAAQKTGTPARYKRRRPEAPASAIGVVEPAAEYDDDEAYFEDDGQVLHHDPLDPLDAQTTGQHERDYELGHEEITLNLEAVDAPHYTAPLITTRHEPKPGNDQV